MTSKNLFLASALLSTLVFSGCATPEQPETTSATTSHVAATPVNATCPIMGGGIDPAGEFATYGDVKVGFCCPGCKPQWEAWSDEEKAEFVAKTR